MRRMRKEKREINLGWLNVMLIASHIYYDAFVSANQHWPQ